LNPEEWGYTCQGVVYRGHHPKWAFSPDSGAGAARRGGRWNSVGTPALYTSERFETAWLECQQGFAFKTQPLTLCTYEVDCGPILDLTDTQVLKALPLPASAWLDEDWLARYRAGYPINSWILATTLIEAGFAGIRVPSRAVGATARDINIVFWRWSNNPPTQVKLITNHA